MTNIQATRPFATVEEVMNFYDKQVAELKAKGSSLLQQANEALNFYESMPNAINHEQAHEAANLLRARIIPSSERDCVDFATCLNARRPDASLREDISAEAIQFWHEDNLPHYRAAQQKVAQAFASMPAWDLIKQQL